jgi:dCMP deaminase
MPRSTPRPNWDDYFLDLVDHVAARATCDRGRSGCVVVRDKRIICTGYVGSPSGLPHCDEEGHWLKRMIDEDGTERQHCVRTVHAEQNAICQAARYGLSLEGTTLYCTMEPCRVCAMLIASVGVARVVAKRRYHAGQDSRHILAQARVRLDVAEDEVQTYE